MIPTELKLFLEEDKILNKKKIAATYGIHDLSFSKHLSQNQLIINLPAIKKLPSLFYFNITSCFLTFPSKEGEFSLKVQIQTDGVLKEHGTIFIGRFDNFSFKTSNLIGTQFYLKKSCDIIVSIIYPETVSAIMNGGITMV